MMGMAFICRKYMAIMLIDILVKENLSPKKETASFPKKRSRWENLAPLSGLTTKPSF
jgi:hypothetical protein